MPFNLGYDPVETAVDCFLVKQASCVAQCCRIFVLYTGKKLYRSLITTVANKTDVLIFV